MVFKLLSLRRQSKYKLEYYLEYMIKFFRHIRYNLMNQNKTAKYIKYAIGEIILVVIGILIAVQINNWNTDRLEKIEVANFLEQIETELESDIIHFICFKVRS